MYDIYDVTCLPLAVQSARLPAVLVNSNRNGGSNVNVGPCVSNEFDATYSEKRQLNVNFTESILKRFQSVCF